MFLIPQLSNFSAVTLNTLKKTAKNICVLIKMELTFMRRQRETIKNLLVKENSKHSMN